MLKLRKLNVVRCLSLLMVGSLIVLSPRHIYGEAEIFTETKEKLVVISEEEKEVLQTLYTMEQEIGEMEKEEENLSVSIKSYQSDITNLEDKIVEDQLSYENNRDVLKEVLRTYQRMGPNSFMEILLDSENLANFLSRLNTLRDLTRNTGELMDTLEVNKKKLAEEKVKLSEKLTLLEDEQNLLRLLLTSKMQLKEEKEAYLIALQDQRELYQDYLDSINIAWEAVKPIFAEATTEFSELVEEGSLPPDALEVSFSLKGVVGRIKEKAFNEVITSNPELPVMIFKFYLDKIELSIPENNLVLTGNFHIEEGHTLKFVAEAGSFYDLPLETGSIDELFEEGYLVLNIEPLIGTSTVESVKAGEGSIELLIQPKLF